MTDQTVSIDEFMSRRKANSRDNVLFKAAKAPASWDATSRKGRFVMSAKAKDRDGDIVFTDGIDLTEFTKNPIALLNHRSSDPIGTWDNIAKGAESMEGDVVLGPAGTTEEIDKAAGLIGAGILRASSIGFIPKTIKRIVLEDGTPTWSYEIIECELVECSLVSIPANPMALAKGSKDEPLTLARDLIEEVLDTYARDPATGLIVPKAEYEAAHKALTGNRHSIVIEAQENETSEGFFKRLGRTLGFVKDDPIPETPPSLPSPEEKAAAIAKAKASQAKAKALLSA
jgi:HK97 family phage prohead protease